MYIKRKYIVCLHKMSGAKNMLDNKIGHFLKNYVDRYLDAYKHLYTIIRNGDSNI
jgi:hypothetical protein